MQIINQACHYPPNPIALHYQKLIIMKKIKYTILFAAAFIISGSTACKKKDDLVEPAGKYYMTFKVNGAAKEFRDGVLSNFNSASSDNEYITALLGGKNDGDPNHNIFAIGLTTKGQNKINVTYTNYKTSTAGSEKAVLVLFSYMDENGTNYSAAFDDDILSSSYPDAVANSQIIITEATSTYVKGKFSGAIYSSGFTKRLDITDGEFYLEED